MLSAILLVDLGHYTFLRIEIRLVNIVYLNENVKMFRNESITVAGKKYHWRRLIPSTPIIYQPLYQ